jgi:hypothetical protein
VSTTAPRDRGRSLIPARNEAYRPFMTANRKRHELGCRTILDALAIAAAISGCGGLVQSSSTTPDDLAPIRRFIRDGGFEVVLCGHQHGFRQRELGGVPIVCSAFQWDKTDEGIEFEAGFHLIDLDGKLAISEHGEFGLLES